jgi:hypothetical protein
LLLERYANTFTSLVKWKELSILGISTASIRGGRRPKQSPFGQSSKDLKAQGSHLAVLGQVV